jgi:hypothetical protein
VNFVKRIIITRHPDDDILDNSLIGKILIFSENQQVAILSSTSPEALENAKLLSEILGIPFQAETTLCSSNEHHSNESVFNLVLSFVDKVDVLILITHYNDTGGFSFTRQTKPSLSPKKCEAWLIDCVQKNFIPIH